MATSQIIVSSAKILEMAPPTLRPMLKKLAVTLLLGLIVGPALAQNSGDIHADSPGYLGDSRTNVLRSGFGLCWRSGTWTDTDAVVGCDGELIPPIVKPTAPALVPGGATTVVTTPLMPDVVVRRCDVRLDMDNDDSFGFGQSVLSHSATARLDRNFRRATAACGLIQSVKVIAYTDRLGRPSNNQRLSERRATAIAAVLRAAAGDAAIDAIGRGSAEPLVSCSDKQTKRKLVACLAPNRRATIEVSGVAK